MRNIKALWFGCYLALAGCTSDEQKGGDHVPELKTYQLASLPDYAAYPVRESAVTSRTVTKSTALRTYVHTGDIYRVCAHISGIDLEAMQSALDAKDDDVERAGFATALRHVFANLDGLPDVYKSLGYSDLDMVSMRPEIRVVEPQDGGCDLLITTVATSEFPFAHKDFDGEETVLLYPSQLRASSASNSVSVGYMRSGLSDKAQQFMVTQLIAAYIGLNASKRAHSRLNPAADPDDPLLSLAVAPAEGNDIQDDTLSMYEFALFSTDVLKLRDLDTLHYYADRLGDSSNAEVDVLLTRPASTNPIGWKALPGNRYLDGVRAISALLKICFDGVDDPADLLDFAKCDHTDRTHKRLMSELCQRDDDLGEGVTAAQSACSLIVTVRSEAQYPFKDQPVSGFFAETGAVKYSDGSATDIPVIYLNGDHLTLDASESGRFMGDVLQHEFAHYLGMRHSNSKESILSPEGASTTWDVNGYDGAMLDEFVSKWNADAE